MRYVHRHKLQGECESSLSVDLSRFFICTFSEKTSLRWYVHPIEICVCMWCMVEHEHLHEIRNTISRVEYSLSQQDVKWERTHCAAVHTIISHVEHTAILYCHVILLHFRKHQRKATFWESCPHKQSLIEVVRHTVQLACDCCCLLE